MWMFTVNEVLGVLQLGAGKPCVLFLQTYRENSSLWVSSGSLHSKQAGIAHSRTVPPHSAFQLQELFLQTGGLALFLEQVCVSHSFVRLVLHIWTTSPRMSTLTACLALGALRGMVISIFLSMLVSSYHAYDRVTPLSPQNPQAQPSCPHMPTVQKVLLNV